MKKYICDHCGKEISDKNDYVDYEFEFNNFTYPCDLCDDCKKEIEKEIDNRLTKLTGGKV